MPLYARNYPYRRPKRILARPYRRRRPTYRRKFRKIRKLPYAGVGKSKIIKMKYCQQISLNPTAGAKVVNVFVANGMYDPDATGTGHQPLGFDQWMTFFDHYNVLGAKITMEYISDTGAPVTPCYFGILLSDDGVSVLAKSNIEHLLESRQTTHKVGVGGDNASSKKLKAVKYFSSKKFFGRNPVQTDLKGSSITNPSEKAFFECWAASVNGNDPVYANFLVTIEYIAKLTEPHGFPQS